MSDQLRAARYYARHCGLAPIPLNGKAPRLPWADLPAEPPSDEQLTDWWKRWPGTSVGVIIGDRHAVLDVDVRTAFDGWDSVHDLEAEHAALPDTWRALTPAGGGHIWFALPAGVTVVTKTLAAGVQLRTGRHVMAMPPAPSRDWELSPTEVGLAELPAWLAGLAQPAASTGGQDYEPLDVPDRIPVEERHDTLVRIARSMRRKGLRYSAILAALVETDREQVDHPPGEREITHQELEEIAQWADEQEGDPLVTPSFAERWKSKRNPLRAAETPANPDPAQEPEEGPKPKPPARPKILDLLLDMEEAVKLADEPLPARIDPLVIDGYLTVLTGIRGAMKSFLAMILAQRCHSGGGMIAGIDCVGGNALYVDAENGAPLIGRRFRDLGFPVGSLLIADGSRVRLPRDIPKLGELIDETEATLFVLDSMRTLAPRTDEDRSGDMSELVSAIRHLTRETGAGGLLLHHRSSKPGAPPSRGSSAIEDQADALFGLSRHHGGRLKLKCLNKYRMGLEPQPMWVQLGTSPGGSFGLTASEAVVDDDDDESDATPQLAEAALVEKINLLAGAVAAEGGWLPSRLAAAVGTNNTGTFKRAMSSLLDSGVWTASGDGPARRLTPAPNQTRPDHPLGDGPAGPVQEEL